MEKNGFSERTVYVDVGARNNYITVYDKSTDRMLTFCHIDLVGEKYKIPSSSVCAERIKEIIRKYPWLTKNVSVCGVEIQMATNAHNMAIANAVKEVYMEFGIKVVTVDPKKMYKHIKPILELVPGFENYADKLGKRSVKKKLSVLLGNNVIRQGVEWRMYKSVYDQRKVLLEKIHSFDNKYKKNRKKQSKGKRRIKGLTNQNERDEAFEGIIGTLYLCDDLKRFEIRMRKKRKLVK